MKTLGLTSPLTRGTTVATLQHALKKNWTGIDFLQGEVDSEFGTQTARGCIRGKFWVGYVRAEMKPIAGPQFLAMLLHEGKVPAANMALRRRRIAAANASVPLRELALRRAEKDLGMKESPPNSNECPVTKRWHMVGAWCAMAVSEWYIDAGSKAFVERVNWAYVPFLLTAAEQGMNGIALVTRGAARPGDPVCFDWDDDGVADHVGLLRSAIRADGTFDTIEGNTAVGNDSNGGQVMHRQRNLGDVATHNGQPALIRVGR